MGVRSKKSLGYKNNSNPYNAVIALAKVRRSLAQVKNIREKAVELISFVPR